MKIIRILIVLHAIFLCSFFFESTLAIAQTNIDTSQRFQNQLDSNEFVVQDSLKNVKDSINKIFETKYKEIIYLNPYRADYLECILGSEYASKNLSLIFSVRNSYSISNIIHQQAIEKKDRPIWVFVSVLFLVFFVGMVKLIFPAEFRLIVEAFYKERLLLQVSRENSIATSWPYIFLYTLFSFAFGLFLVVYFSKFESRQDLSFLKYIQASVTVALLFINKILVCHFVSYVFQIEKIMREYITVLYLVYFNSMLILLPFLFTIILIPTVYFENLAIIFLTLAFILLIYRMLRTFTHIFVESHISLSYFILYLCALEIAPVLILIRALGS